MTHAEIPPGDNWLEERERLRREIARLEAELAQALSGVGARGGAPAVREALEAELARVDQKITEVTAFIDDPASALPNVIRKNVERAELEAYRRGLSFRLDLESKES